MGRSVGTSFRSVLLLLLLLWLCCFNEARELILTCPARCRCDLILTPRTVNCSNKGLIAFPSNVSSFVERLDLSGNQLEELSMDVNRLTELRQLLLARNKLSSLPVNLRGLANLRDLDLSGNALKSVDDLVGLRHLVRLQSLFLTGNALRQLDGLKNPSLRLLKANSCGIKKLENTSLLGLPELTHLNLANNPLTEINNPLGPKLEGLDLSKCRLNVLRSHVFQGFPELLELRLSDNPTLVYSTRDETLRHPKLQKIDASRCDLDRPGLHGLPSLTYAKLTGNSIRILPDRIFSKNRELTHLFLDNNHIEHLNKSAFVNLLGLQVLGLSGNGLKSVFALAFRENILLQYLNLSNNYLMEFPKLSSSVAILDLALNLISKMDRDSLDGMPKLIHLDLSRNFFREIPRSVISDSLRNWSLKNNHIWTMENITFTGLPELERLDLSGNLLNQGLSPSLFDHNPNLQQIQLHDNPWICDCRQLRALYFFLKNLASDMEPLICHSPSNVTGYSWQLACANDWTKESVLPAQNKKAYGLILVSLLTLVVLVGMVVSIRHTMRLKRQARNQRIEMERAEVRERLRLLQRRNQRLHEELREHSQPRIHPLELLGPPSYEEAVTMTRHARSLDALDSVTENQGSNVMRITGSSESLRTSKKRRPRRANRRLRSQSEDNLARREMRREERLRRARESMIETEDGSVVNQAIVTEDTAKPRPQTPPTVKRKSKRLLAARNGTSTDDEDSDLEGRGRGAKRTGRNVAIRNLEREPRSGYRPSTDGES